MRQLVGFLFLAAAGCAGAEVLDLDTPPRPTPPVPAPRQDSLSKLVEEAVATHPRVRQARARAEAAVARAGGASSLDDPMLFVKSEEVPWRHPFALNSDGFNAVGLSQMIPLFKTGLRADVAAAEARRMAEDPRMAALEIASQVRRAWAEHLSATREQEVHSKHAGVMKSLIAAAEARYAAGKVSQQDVLDARNGAAMIDVEVAATQAQMEESRAALLELAGRVPPNLPAPPVPPALKIEEAEAMAAGRRPDLRAAEREVERAQAALRLASRERWAPDLTAEFMTMQMPDEPDGWGATLWVTLPWFSPKRKAEETAAGRELEAARDALEAAQRMARREVAGAWHRLRSAQRSVEVQEKELLPRAQQSLDVARANYEQDRVDFLRLLDAERMLRSTELEWVRARGQVDSAWAELERAMGTSDGGVR